MAKKDNNNNSRGASASAVAAFAASNPNSRTAQAAAPKASPAPAAKAVQTNAGPNPMGAPAKPASLTQALKIAGSDGNITKKELSQVTNQFDVNPATAVKRLDQLNTGMADRGKDLQIGLGSNAVNSLIKEGNTYTSGIFRGTQFGDGKIGSAVQNYINASNPTGGYQNPQSGASSYKPVSGAMGRAVAQSAAGLIPLQRGGAYQINAKGGYSPKVSNSAFSVQTAVPSAQPTPTVSPIPEPNTIQEPDPVLPVPLPEEEKMDPGPGMLSGGGMGAAGANKIGRAKSRIRQLGIYGRGTGLLGRGLQYGNTLNK